MKAIQRLKTIQGEGLFIATIPFEQFISDLCERYARIYKEILPTDNFEYILLKLEEQGLLD